MGFIRNFINLEELKVIINLNICCDDVSTKDLRKELENNALFALNDSKLNISKCNTKNNLMPIYKKHVKRYNGLYPQFQMIF